MMTMRAHELQIARAELDLPQADLAYKLGSRAANRVHAARWITYMESGRRAITPLVEQRIKNLLRAKRRRDNKHG